MSKVRTAAVSDHVNPHPPTRQTKQVVFSTGLTPLLCTTSRRVAAVH